jgi:hypothetical protein
MGGAGRKSIVKMKRNGEENGNRRDGNRLILKCRSQRGVKMAMVMKISLKPSKLASNRRITWRMRENKESAQNETAA